MRMYDIIAKKRDGGELTKEEIGWFVGGCVSGEIPDYQISALLMAVYLRGMTARETADLTLGMAASGDVADLSTVPGVTVDKHSTGGVGDKTTLVAVPMAASLGVSVAKMSGRGLGHTGGTIDKLESIPGLTTALGRERFLETVRKVGCCIAGQSGNLVPADKKLYALRDVTATVDCVPLIASSVMSKKLASGSRCILLDVKAGSGAFMKTPEDAAGLARAMVEIGKRAGRRTVALVTAMDRPLGNAVGNWLEVREACETLKGRGPEDLTELSVELAAGMLFLAGGGDLRACRIRAERSLGDGSAFRKFREMAEAQGGDASVLDDPSRYGAAEASYPVTAPESGYVFSMDTEQCGEASVLLGAGREKLGDAIDPFAGFVLFKKTGDRVEKGEPLAVLYSRSAEQCRAAAPLFARAVSIRPQKPEKVPLILARIAEDGEEWTPLP